MKDLIIRPLALSDQKLLPEVLSLLNRTQGQGLFNTLYVEKFIGNDKARMFLAFSDADSHLIGVAGTELINNYDYYLPFDANIAQRFAGKTVGSFATMTVHEKFQGQGIGQKLSQERLKWLKEMKSDSVVGVSWVSGLKHTSDRVFEKMGFKPVQRVEGFYTDYARKNPFDCPGCHAPACTCAAIMYLKEL